MFDIDKLLGEISPEAPCGPDLEYDREFIDLERAAAGKPERAVGSTVIPAEEPSWADVHKRAVALFGRTKDLRVFTHLVKSAVRLDGLGGLAASLTLLEGLLERHWDNVHPRLDAEAGNDPTARMNAISTLADWDAMVKPVRELPLLYDREIGPFSFRDFEVTRGAEPAPPGLDKAKLPRVSDIEGAFAHADLAELQALAAVLGRSAEALAGINATLAERVGSGAAPNLDALVAVIGGVSQLVSSRLALRGESSTGGAEATADPTAQPSATANTAAAGSSYPR